MKKLILLAIVFTGLVQPGNALAQDNRQEDTLQTQGLKVSPAIFEAVVKPGQTIKKEFFVVHDSREPLPVQIEPRPLDPIEQIIDMGKISTFNAAEWIEVNEPYHILSNQETKRLTATITAPKDAEPGGHYAMISVEVLEAATNRTQRSGASITPRLGILAFITVPGPVTRDVSITKDRFLPRITANEIVRLTPDFKNTGTIHVMHNSKVQISNIFGSREIEIPSRIILPNTIKEIQGVWRDVPLIGIYKAKLKGSYGPEMAKIESRNQYIFVFRWLPLLAILLPLGLIGWAAYRTKGRWGDAVRAFKAVEKVVENEVKEVEEKVEKALHHKKKKEPAQKKKSKPTVPKIPKKETVKTSAKPKKHDESAPSAPEVPKELFETSTDWEPINAESATRLKEAKKNATKTKNSALSKPETAPELKKKTKSPPKNSAKKKPSLKSKK